MPEMIEFVPSDRKPVTVTLELYPDGKMMYVILENWRPVNLSFAIDPEAHTFAEGVRQLTVQIMRRTLEVPT